MSFLLPPGFGSMSMGMPIIEDRNMVDVVEDWSGVRSKSRAERRRKRGFPQRIVYREVPKKEVYQFQGKLVMHPEMARALRNSLQST